MVLHLVPSFIHFPVPPPVPTRTNIYTTYTPVCLCIYMYTHITSDGKTEIHVPFALYIVTDDVILFTTFFNFDHFSLLELSPLGPSA